MQFFDEYSDSAVVLKNFTRNRQENSPIVTKQADVHCAQDGLAYTSPVEDMASERSRAEDDIGGFEFHPRTASPRATSSSSSCARALTAECREM